MFTGIVEEMGTLRSRRGPRFEFEASAVLEDLKIGDSVAHDGCCLTVVEIGGGWYAVEAVDETLGRTTLGHRQAGDQVNLERPLRPFDRLGGHIVQGHVDGVGEVITPAPALEVGLDPALLRYVVPKGSIAVDGCSLTVVEVRDGSFTVAVIPHTLAVTTLGLRRRGDRVNIEIDLVAKYVERLAAPTSLSAHLDNDKP